MSKHTFLVSDESINCYDLIVRTGGIDTTQFEKNPIMLYMHERPRVIGRWENLKKEGGKLYADAVFDTDDLFASEIAGKVERGFLKSASVGLGNVSIKNDTVVSCKLFEISIVDIGGNSNALRLYRYRRNGTA
jgi:phage head maturation protease